MNVLLHHPEQLVPPQGFEGSPATRAFGDLLRFAEKHGVMAPSSSEIIPPQGVFSYSRVLELRPAGGLRRIGRLCAHYGSLGDEADAIEVVTCKLATGGDVRGAKEKWAEQKIDAQKRRDQLIEHAILKREPSIADALETVPLSPVYTGSVLRDANFVYISPDVILSQPGYTGDMFVVEQSPMRVLADGMTQSEVDFIQKFMEDGLALPASTA